MRRKHKTKAEIQSILRLKASNDDKFCAVVADYLCQISALDLQHPTSISEGITWAKFLKSTLSEATAQEIKNTASYTIGFLAKDNMDRRLILDKVFEGAK